MFLWQQIAAFPILYNDTTRRYLFRAYAAESSQYNKVKVPLTPIQWGQLHTHTLREPFSLRKNFSRHFLISKIPLPYPAYNPRCWTKCCYSQREIVSSVATVMAYMRNLKLATVSLCLLKVFHVANSTKLNDHNPSLATFHAMKFYLGSHSAGVLMVGSVMSICLVFLPLVRLSWKRRTPDEENGEVHDSVGRLRKKLVDLHDVVVENAQLTDLERSASFEEVKLSFGTDKPEVYLNMCSCMPAKKMRPLPRLHELLVQ